jgi:hypothetical protein
MEDKVIEYSDIKGYLQCIPSFLLHRAVGSLSTPPKFDTSARTNFAISLTAKLPTTSTVDFETFLFKKFHDECTTGNKSTAPSHIVTFLQLRIP